MSGKRQHFIPRFLQKGFASHVKEDEVYTWVFRKDATPFNTNIKNVGVEGNFYSASDGNQADDNLTEAEDGFSKLVAELFENQDASNLDTGAIAEMIAHLEVRTRHIRQNVSNFSAIIFEEMVRFCRDEHAFNRYIQNKVEKDPSFLGAPLEQEFKKNDIPISLIPIFLQANMPQILQMLPQVLPNIRNSALLFLQTVIPLMEESLKRGHIEALNRGLSPAAKAEAYSELEYQLIRTEENSLPLGDSILVFHIEGDSPYKSFYEKDESLIGIYLPLSSNTVLAGLKTKSEPIISELPKAISKCSLEYFISSAKNDLTDSLHSQIGMFANILSTVQIELILDEFWNI